MSIRLIALDIDGTLTNDEKKITPRTREALLLAEKKGVRLVLASARPSPGLYEMRDQLQMGDYGGILMSYNGGRIVDAGTGEVLSSISMEEEMTRRILRCLETLPVVVILDDGRQFYVKDRKAYKVEYECRNNHMICSEVESLADFLHFSPVKLLLAVEPDLLLPLQRQIAEQLPEELTVVRTAPFYLEIIPRAINKGRGLMDICRILEIAPEDTVAFGDAENDLPMLQAAGIGVAMGNAETVVKAQADRVTKSNNEDGIAAALEELHL